MARVFSKKLGVFDKYSSRAQNTLPAIAGNPTFFGSEIEENACLQQ